MPSLTECSHPPREHAGVGRLTSPRRSDTARAAGHTVLYVEASDMLKQLRAARADGSYDRRLLRFTTPALLIIDDLGLRSLVGEELGEGGRLP